MEPAILKGDRILVNHAAYRRRGIERGDVVAYEPADARSLWVHRVVGLPGDTIECDRGRVLIDGEPVRSAAAAAADPSGGAVLTSYRFNAVTVPEDHVFVMGDHSDVSRDSRFDGCLPIASIAGRVDYVIVSPQRSAWMLAMDGTR
jgi:signal peptidase I